MHYTTKFKPIGRFTRILYRQKFVLALQIHTFAKSIAIFGKYLIVILQNLYIVRIIEMSAIKKYTLQSNV